MHYAIIAAGEGSRLREEGINVPKPLVCLDGTTLIGRLTDIFRHRADCSKISVIISPAVAESGAEIDADNILTGTTPGSMHSLHRLSPLLKGCGHFCLTTVDTVFDSSEFDSYIEAFMADGKADGYMGVTSYIDDEKPLYVTADTDGMITGYFDTPVEQMAGVSAGIYLLPESALDILDECVNAEMTRMRDFQRALVASGMRLRAYPFTKVIDIDHASDIAKALEVIHDNR